MKIELVGDKAVAPCVFKKSAFRSAITELGYFVTGNIHDEYGYRRTERPKLWCKVKKIVLFDDPNSVSLVDSKVWRDNINGTAFMEQGRDAEARAREHAMTHKRCTDCHELYEKQSFCRNCSELKDKRRWARMPTVEYAEQICCIRDRWFYDADGLRDYLLEHDLLPKDALIEDSYSHDLPEIELEHWHDDLPEDYDESSLHHEIISALNMLNAAIRKHGKGVSYFPNGKRIVLPDDFVEGDGE